jgi:spermidine/putrescine-binding protein
VGRRVIHKVKNKLTKLTNLHKSEALKKSRFSRANLVVFAIIFASIGGYLIYSSYAAGNTCISATWYGGTSDEITYTFDKSYPCGTFANGDWWVAPNVGDTAVKVISITPDYAGGLNG